MTWKRIAAQLWTIREALKTPSDFARSMERLREMGYGAVEPCLPAVVEPAEMKRILDANDLEVCGSHGPLSRLSDDVAGLVADHRTLGCRLPGTGGLRPEKRNLEGFRALAAAAERAGAKLREAGMTFVYHNHAGEFARFDGRTGIEIMADESAPEHLAFELDLYWVQAAGADPAAWIRRLGPRVPLVHCKDMGLGRDGKPHSMPVGCGNLNWPAILAASGDAGVKWLVVEVEEEHAPGGPFESLRVSIDNLRAWGA